MKKRLSILIVIALVFSLFSSLMVANASEVTPDPQTVTEAVSQNVLGVTTEPATEPTSTTDTIESTDPTNPVEQTGTPETSSLSTGVDEATPPPSGEPTSTQTGVTSTEEPTQVKAESTTEPTTEPTAEPTEPTESAEPTDIEATVKDTKNAIHLRVTIKSGTDFNYIPEFKVQLRSETGTVISTIEASKSNYNANMGYYELAFPVKDAYNVGSKFQIYLVETDGIAKTLEIYDDYYTEDGGLSYNSTKLKEDNYHKLTIRKVEYYTDDAETKLEATTNATKTHPILASLETDISRLGIQLKTPDGKAITNAEATIIISQDKIVAKKPNGKGLLTLSASEVKGQSYIRIALKGYLPKDGDSQYQTIVIPAQYVAGTVDGMSIIPVVFQYNQDSPVWSSSDSANANALSISVKESLQEGVTSLSDYWQTAEVTLVDQSVDPELQEAFIYTVDKEGLKVQGLPDGTYTVTATSQNADVKLSASTLEVKNNKASLTLTLTPKYLLQVDKDGKEYSFSFVGLEGVEKVFKGSKPVKFAVASGESYMVQDTNTETVSTVAIDANSPLTRLVLGAGIVFGGSVTSPHTGDAIIYLLVIFGVLTAALITLFVIYSKRNNLNLKKSVPSLILAFALTASLFTSLGAPTAHAAIGSGSEGSNTGGSKTPKGLAQASNNIAVMQLGFLPAQDKNGSGQLTEDATKVDLETGYQFGHFYLKAPMFYISPNKESYDIFRSSTSYMSFFDKASGRMKLLYGTKDALYASDSSSVGAVSGSSTSKEAMNSRILPPSEEIKKNKNSSDFEKFAADALDLLGSNSNANRKLWIGDNSTSRINIGDAFQSTFMTQLGMKLFTEEEKAKLMENYLKLSEELTKKALENKIITIDEALAYLDVKEQTELSIADRELADAMARDAMDAIFKSYIEFLRKDTLNPNSQAVATQLELYYTDDNPETGIVFFAQSVPAFYDAGSNPRSYAFVPYSEASNWYYSARSKDNTSVLSGINMYHQAAVVNNPKDNGSKTTAASTKTAPTSTFKYNMQYTSAISMKPKTPNLPIIKPTDSSASVKANPFAGWGYIPWLEGSKTDFAANHPRIKMTLNVHILDADGEPTGKVITKDLDEYLEEDETGKKVGVRLWNLEEDANFTIENQLTIDGNLYILDRDHKPSVLLHSDLGNRNLMNGATGKTYNNTTTPIEDEYGNWTLYFDHNLPHPHALNAILGGNDRGFEGLRKLFPEGAFSNATANIHVSVRDPFNGCNPFVDDSCTPFQGVVEDAVPEWRLSKYWTTLPVKNNSTAHAMYSWSPPSYSGSDPKTNYDKDYTFGYITSNISDVDWLSSQGRPKTPSEMTQYVGVGTYLGLFEMTGNLHAIRTNGSVDNIKYADWVNTSTPFGSAIGAASKGATSTKSKIVKNTILGYPIVGMDTIRYSQREFSHWSTPDEFGNSYAVYDRYSYNRTVSYYDAQYDTTITFYRHNPTGTTVKTFAPKTDKQNAVYWETKQEDTTFKINPEVLMAYQTSSGTSGVTFVAGDRLRDIRPVTYNLARFKDVAVNPVTTGMSTATDQTAKTLSNSLGGNNKDVILKGSAVTNSFEVQGELELKTYTVDIGTTSLKNSWNPGINYNTDKINEEFLTKYATKDATTGLWTTTLNAEGKFVIDRTGNEFGGQTKSMQVTQDQPTRTTTYTLEVRGGKLVGVNGNRNLNSLSTDLKEALERMNISTDSNIFSTLQTNKGAQLYDNASIYAQAKAIRGVDAWKDFANWYNEDTTVLVIREYTTTFKLPNFEYSDQLPMEITGLETPIDKSNFYSKGQLGYLRMTYATNHELSMTADTSQGGFGVSKTPQYVVPNVSVMDTFNTVQ